MSIINNDNTIDVDLRSDFFSIIASSHLKALKGLDSIHQAEGTIARLVEANMRKTGDITFDENEDNLLF